MPMSPEVDGWFAERKPPLAAEMQAVRQAILDADARVEEGIKWQTPTFSYRGNIASFNPAKNLVSLLFHRGAEIPGDHPMLEGDGRLARTMRFMTMEDIETGRPELQAVVVAWCDWRDEA